jgi:hypothetical protein
MSGLMKSVMNENQNSQSQVHVTVLRYLRFKPGKQALNSPLTCPAGGGGRAGGADSHTLPNQVTGNWRSTRHSRGVITLRPSALLEIYFLFINSSSPKWNLYLIFVTGEDDIARFDSRRYSHSHGFHPYRKCNSVKLDEPIFALLIFIIILENLLNVSKDSGNVS